MSLLDASVDLNPHQIEAAMFAFRSPFSKGVLLADEVGLGKTIEAGLVICQYWAERKRRLIVSAQHRCESNGAWNWRRNSICQVSSWKRRVSVKRSSPAGTIRFNMMEL
jgi:hypothetical protein